MTRDARRIHVVAGALIDAHGRVLIARRAARRHQGGLWEFPGGKLEPGETPLQGLRRELYEELGVRIGAARPLIQIPHDYPDRSILLDLYRIETWDGEPQGREGQPLIWQSPQALDPADFPPADGPAIVALRLSALYLITPELALDAIQTNLPHLNRALQAGVGVVQLRAPHLSTSVYAALARTLAPYCRQAGVLLILNGAPESLAGLPADGWHLSSARLHALRERPRQAPPLLGASCHCAADLTVAQDLGLDYALLSPVKFTQSHPQAHPLGWERFAQLVAKARLPVYALGGLGSEDLQLAWQHGAQGVAAMRAFWPC